MKSPKNADLPTYVYIDGSNIRFACKNGLKFDLDYKKLYKYLSTKYSKLARAVYFEGRSSDDAKKLEIFAKYRRYGYEVLSLDRKKYVAPAMYKNIKCRKCGRLNKVKIAPKTAKLKSNVDVYICSEMMFDALKAKGAAHFVLLSCDGDYAEMIRKLALNRPTCRFTVLATPYTKPVNFLSKRLQEIRRQLPNYTLADISNIKDKIN